MNMPRTTAIAATLTGLAAAIIAWAQTTFHWADVQTAAVSGAGIATIALVSFIVEHLRKETPSRWVGVIGMIPAEVAAVVSLGIVFAWWTESATQVTGFISALLLPLATLLGVTVAQAKVYAPETTADVAQAVASAKNVDPATHAR